MIPFELTRPGMLWLGLLILAVSGLMLLCDSDALYVMLLTDESLSIGDDATQYAQQYRELGMVLVVDKSGSMGGDKMQMAFEGMAQLMTSSKMTVSTVAVGDGSDAHQSRGRLAATAKRGLESLP